jgi:hypothetical protein
MTQTSTGSARSRLRDEIDLPTPVAIWVLAAHALTLFSPLVLVWVTHRNADALGAVLDAPFALHVGAALFFTGSAFEISQNTMDRWYYQGPYPAFADLLFNAFIAFGLGALALAAGVDGVWVVAVVVAAAVTFPVLYPAILLLLVFTTGLNLYFLALIVRTKAQSLHGAIALTNGIGLLAVPLAMQGWLNDAPMSWRSVLSITLVLTVAAAAAWQPLSRLAPTHRPSAR